MRESHPTQSVRELGHQELEIIDLSKRYYGTFKMF